MSRFKPTPSLVLCSLIFNCGVVTVLAQDTPSPGLTAAQRALDGNDKIDGEIIAHQLEKVRPPLRSPEAHSAHLQYLGLNTKDLDRENCALYVRERLTPADITELKSKGIDVNPWLWVPPVKGKHPFGFHLASVSYTSLDVLRADHNVVRVISTEFIDKPDNDLGGMMIHVDDVHNGVGIIPRDGTGVKVAIADTGMDLTHADLPTPVEAYDMTDGTGPGTWGTNVSNTVSAHGTHVTGTAVGSGALSGGQYVGAAPGASLYFYKIGNDSTGSASQDDIIEAINRAVTAGCDVYSMSFGGYRIWMDGSEPMEQAVDAAFAAGTVCFLSAGNTADGDAHDSLSVAPGATSPVFTLTIDNTSGGSTLTAQQHIRVIWIDNANYDLNMALSCTNLGGGESFVQAYQGTSTRGTEAKRYVLSPSVPAGSSKTYNLTLHNNTGSGTTPLVHCYVTIGTANFDSPDPYYTVTGSALADDAIAVGAWTQRRGWINYLGDSYYWPNFIVGTLAPFSGRGPRVDGVIKPNIVAPGASTISSRDSTPGLASSFYYIIDNDGLNLDGSGPANYYLMWGTSMATPLAAGSAALILENTPALSPAQVRDVLQSTASMAESPTDDAGYGLIDVYAAITSDCNGTGLNDTCDVDCDAPGCAGLPGCGLSPDCNSNAYPDECELLDSDCNANQVPDECDVAELLVASPQNMTECAGETVQFSAVTQNPPATTYLWLKGGAPLSDGGRISGVTTDTLTISNLQVSDAGTYACYVAEGCIETQSDYATLTVLSPARITADPTASLTRCEGDGATFTVTATGTAPITYEWLKDGGPLGAPNSPTLFIGGVVPDDQGAYTCIVSNLCGSDESMPGVLSVQPLPHFTQQPQSACGEVGDTVVLHVEATASVTFYYQWRKGSTTVGSGDTLTLSSIQPAQAGDYYAVAFTLSPTCINNSDTAMVQVGGCPTCAASADFDDDGDCDLADFSRFTQCFGLNVVENADCACANVDDADWVVDHADWSMMAPVVSGPQ